MSVLTGALGSLGPKLLNLLHDEYKLQTGVKKQVQWLHSELESIYAFLGEVAQVPWDRLNGQVKVWVREVREASYDMEDVLDTYLVRVHGGEPADPSRLKRAMKKMGKVFTKAKSRHDIADAIEDIKKYLQEISERRQRYKLDELVSKQDTTKSSIDPRLTATYKKVAEFVGVQKKMDELISMLNPSQPDDDVAAKNIVRKVSIVGVGGLGKTTLAKAVYENLKSQFDCTAFVSVGRDLDLVKLLKDILFRLDKENYKKIHNDGRGFQLLIDEVREFLENKRYLIVVDDVWRVPTWKLIEAALIENNCGSKVITTTRNFDVAKASGEVYKLQPLSDDDSMNLFCTRISGPERKCLNKDPDKISEKIINKCAGIPLAIITMSSLFADKAMHQWSMVFNSIGSVYDQDSIEVKDTMTIISFSYYDLSPDLKTCLLYLSTYPEDYEIEKDSLIWKWIAEGFIIEKEGSTLFEVGERYFSDLINRSLIQIVESSDGRVSSCCIHDMVLDMIRKFALEENFALLGDNVEGTPAQSSVRRLAYQNIRAQHNNPDATVTEMTKVRSYSTFLCSIHNLDQYLRFKVLRVLDIVDCSFEEGCHLDHLGDLLHLRYLGIRGCEGICHELPKQIEKLKLLQTIDVDTVLPQSIVKLTKLECLRASLMDTQDGIGNLTSLQELIIKPNHVGHIPKRFMKELGRLEELRVLKFCAEEMGWVSDGSTSSQRDFVNSLRNLKKIKHIDVRAFLAYADTDKWEAEGFVLPESLCYLVLLFKFSKMPSCIDPTGLPYLTHLDLFVTTMDEHNLRPIATLPELCYLCLGTESTVTARNINVGDVCFFPKLRYLSTRSVMVQFEQPNEKDASISFHLLNGKEHAMPFISRKSKDSSKPVVPPIVMPNLEVLQFNIPLKAIKDNNGDCAGSFGIEYLPSLREIRGSIDCRGVLAEEVVAALAALEKACEVHPKNPTVQMHKINYEINISVETGALGSFAAKLLQLLHGEYKLHEGVRKQVESLHRELVSIHASLGQVFDVPWDRLDEQVKDWARLVREACYDMEDVLDTFLLRIHGGEAADPSRLNRCIKKMSMVFNMAMDHRAIKDIKKHLEEVAERRPKYKPIDMIMSKATTSSSAIDPRLTTMNKEVPKLIGIDKSTDQVIYMLNISQPDDDAPDKKSIKKVSVVGVGGLGKTTLAKAVYEMLKSQYDCGAFVSVGRDHDLVKVFKDILYVLDKNRYENIHNTGRGIDLLIREVRQFLENKRYFLVFDDVWEVQTWKRINLVLVENNCGSKVITTTRKLDVAEEAGEVFKLKPLSYADSMILFYNGLFSVDEKYFDNRLVDDIANKILKKCAGIPLAIITMSGLLVGKPNNEWSEIYNSIGFGSKDNIGVEDTMTTISFLYFDLPPHLRTCLLYLSTYPQGYLITKDVVIWKWIAEGFVQGDQGTRLFDLGERYFNDLINRSLIQLEEKSIGLVSCSRVHDMILDLLRKLSFEENFVAILDDIVEITPALSNVRRVALQRRTAENINYESRVTGMPQVRSYTAFMCFIDSHYQFWRFKLLRVLDIVDCNFKETSHLEHLCDLLHLRYLGIKYKDNVGPQLPKQIGNLKLLQTLDVYGKLPTSIVQLTNLVRLCIHRNVPDGIGKLVSLEELIITNSWSDKPKIFLNELRSLPELRVLKFATKEMDESMQRDFVESISCLQKIKHIQVYGSFFVADTLMWEAAGFVLPRSISFLGCSTITLSKFPSCINPSCLPNLSFLILSVITMDEQDLKLLARFPALRYIDLSTMSTVTASNINSGDGCLFQNLRTFRISGMVLFEQLSMEDNSISLHMWNGEGVVPFGVGKSNEDSSRVAPFGVMPNLEELQFSVRLRTLKDNNFDCGNIGLDCLPCLRKVTVSVNCGGMSPLEVDAALAVLTHACTVHPNHPTLEMFIK